MTQELYFSSLMTTIAAGVLTVVPLNNAIAQEPVCCEVDASPVTSPGEAFARSLAISGIDAVVGAPLFEPVGDPNDDNPGRAYVYAFNVLGQVWELQVAIASDDIANGDEFGHAVAIDGEVIVVGARKHDLPLETDAGAVYVFERVDGNWGQVAKLTVAAPVMDDEFGTSVSISGDIVVVGAPFEDSAANGAGAVYVFEKPQGGWTNMTETVKLTASDATATAAFGFSVSTDGTVLIGGALNAPVGIELLAGKAYIFRDNGSTWVQEQVLTAPDPAQNDKYGYSVSMSPDGSELAIVGAPFKDNIPDLNTGFAYVYRYNGLTTTWEQEARFSPCDAAQGDEFGFSVGIDTNIAVVAAQENSFPADKGSAHAFKNFGNGWARIKELVDDEGAVLDLFGTSVVLKGDKALVGAANFNGGNGAMFGYQDFVNALACDCPWDFDGDGNVGAFDLLFLLAAWGPCNDCNDCPADFDGDCSVGANDLLALLANWGQCVEEGVPIRNAQDCIDKFYPDEIAALIACIEAIGE